MSLKKNVTANYFGQGWAAIMSLAFIPLYIRYLGMEAYGLIGIFAVLQAWLVLLDMGMTPTLSREMARFTGGVHNEKSIRDLLRSVEIIAGLVAVTVALAIYFSSSWLAVNWVQSENISGETIANAFAIMGLVIALGFLQNIYVSSLVGLQRQVQLNVVLSFFSTLRGLGAVGVLIFGSPTIEAFFLWQGFVSIANLIVFAAVVYKTLPATGTVGSFSIQALKGIWRFASGMFGLTVLSLVLTQVDKIILSKLLVLEDFGHYTLAFAVASVLMRFVLPIDQAFYPLMIEQVTRDDNQKLILTYHKGAQMVSVLMGTAAIVLIFFGKTVLYLWTGDLALVSKTAPLVAVLALGNLLNGLMHFPYHLQLAHGWTSLSIKINIISIIVLMPAIIVVTPIYGAIGVAWIWVLLNACYVIVGGHFMYLRLIPEEKWKWYVKDLLLPIGSASIAAMLLYSFMPTISGWLLQFAGLLLKAGIVFAIAIFSASALRQQAVENIKLLPGKVKWW